MTANKLTKKFAWLPIRRWVKNGHHTFTTRGFYWFRYVKVMRAGLLDEWTAYAHYNDNPTTETEERGVKA